MEKENDREVELTSRSFLISIVSSNFPGSLEEIGWRYIASSMHNIHARIPPGLPLCVTVSGGCLKIELRRGKRRWLEGISLSRKRELSIF